MSFKQTVFNHLKNLPGWRTKRKLVVISVDDYGNVRLDSKKARKNMDKAGMKVYSRFDAYDTLETREDLEALYEVLTSVKDKHGNHAVFTPFALPCNINFEAMKEEGYERYIYELLPETYHKLSGYYPKSYEGAWEMWQEGVRKGLMVPQYHGREHFNLAEFRHKITQKDREAIIALENRSYTSISKTLYPTRGWTASFAFWDPSEIEDLMDVAKDGLENFKKVFGYVPQHFMAPTANVPHRVVKALNSLGIKASDYAIINTNHLGFGKTQKESSYTGQKKDENLKIVRNVVFEPTQNKQAVSIAMNQIKAAFRMGKPAIISSHRVNFCGLIDKRHRKKGLKPFKILLREIVSNFPDAEFISSSSLIDEIKKSA